MGLVVVDEQSKRMQSGPKKKTKLKKKLNVFRKLKEPVKETYKLPKEQDGKTGQQMAAGTLKKVDKSRDPKFLIKPLTPEQLKTKKIKTT